MNSFGKILGFLLGWRMFGLPGALLGCYLGHLIDKQEAFAGNSYRRRGSRIFQSASVLEEKHRVFFTCVFSMLAKLAKADGFISEAEILVVERFMIDDLKLDPRRQEFAKGIFRSARKSEKTFEAYAREFHAVFRRDTVMLENLLGILMRLSQADGHPAAAEIALLRNAAAIFGLGERDFERLRSERSENPDRHYAILGCKKDSSVDEIKKSYRKLVKENHPDGLRARGQPEEFRAIAAEKFRAIQEAYEVIKERRGFT